MDHLPGIEDSAYPWPKVPCLCRVEDYDSQGVVGFFERAGWKIDKQLGPVRMDEVTTPLNSQGALIQAWLFFGLLQDFFQISELNVDMHDFVQQQADRSFVTTALLKRHLDVLAKREDGQKAEICQQRQGQIQKCLCELQWFFSEFNSNKTNASWDVSSVLSTDLVLSMLILGETVRNAAMQLWPVPHGESPLRLVYFLQRQNPLRHRFTQEGWCRSEVSMLTREMDNTALFLASLLKLPFSQKLNHESCTEMRCLALQTSDDDYKTKHADDCPRDASCTEVSISQEKICSILRSGGTPMIYVPFIPDHGNPPKVRIIDYNANGLEYVAISHVWAHGLGNPNANALPSCQILRMKRLSAELLWSSTRRATQPAFWIDTLCIPVAPEHKQLRKLAITKLADTFRQARQVLVLDADLQRSSSRCSRTEQATRILCSGWMKRLWTLQEAVVTYKTPNCSKLDVQFLEGPIEFNSVAGKSVLSLYNTESAMKSIFSAFPQLSAIDRTYAFLTRALEYRTTSKLEDEAICLATIMGIQNLKSVVDGVTAEQRMQTMYTLIKELPASVLFHRYKRLRNGFRWAPASLLGNSRNYVFSGPSAKCDAEGLHIRFAGYVVTGHNTQPTSPTQFGYYIGNLHEAEPKMWMKSLDDPVLSNSRSWMGNGVELDKVMRATTTPGLVVNPYYTTESALVSVTEERGGVIYATFLTKVYIKKPNMAGLKVHQDWKRNFIETREVSSDQRWCIS